MQTELKQTAPNELMQTAPLKSEESLKNLTRENQITERENTRDYGEQGKHLSNTCHVHLYF